MVDIQLKPEGDHDDRSCLRFLLLVPLEVHKSTGHERHDDPDPKELSSSGIQG